MGTFETYKFLSTLSLRRATIHVGDYIPFNCTFLSTLSLRRATRMPLTDKQRKWHFYPRSPCGERLQCQLPGQPGHDFYPRSPCGERLLFIIYSITDNCISIHALLAESDAGVSTHCETVPDFYPRSPCGERRAIVLRITKQGRDFYPRSPCGERQKI